MTDNLHFRLCDHGAVLASRRRGREVAEHLRELADDQVDVILDFDGVEASTPPFLQELLDAVQGVIGRDPDWGRLVVAANLNEDIAETLALVLERRKTTLAYRVGDQVELLKAAPHLAETLREAQKLRSFTVNDLAEQLDLKPTAVHQRLRALLASGAVAREDGEAHHGRGHRYRAATSEAPALELAAR